MNESAYTIYVTFHGGKDPADKKKDKDIVNDVQAVPWTGTVPSQPAQGPYASVLAPASGPYKYDEMRGMALDAQGLLYVANGAKSASAVYVFSQPDSKGVRSPVAVLVQSGTTNPGIDHPYGLTMAPSITDLVTAHGTLYVSNQDSNAVCAYEVQGGTTQLQATPLAVASYLTTIGPASSFYPGEVVGSQTGESSGGITPPDVPKPAGLSIDFTPSAATKSTSAQHSVRGVLFVDGTLFVADEDNDSVNLYDATSGEFASQITGLDEPVGLAFDPTSSLVYIAAKSTIYTCDTDGGSLQTVAKGLDTVSGITVGPDGSVFFALRTQKELYVLDPTDPSKQIKIAEGFQDEPECLLTYPTGS